ncbi:MAG: CHRD domain-containing protein [Chthoniobacteraceae bacterium]
MKLTPFVFAFIGLTSLAQAHLHTYTADLSGLNEAVPNASPGIGFSTVTLDLDLITMQVEVDFSDLLGVTTAAAIHGATTFPFTGTAGPMSPPLAATGFPLGVTAGSYDHTFDLTDAPGYSPSFITASGGTVGDALNALAFSFEDGTAYLSIQSSAFPGGEIRAFYTEVSEVPEPSTWLFALPALVGGSLRLRQRRHEVVAG